jgi:xanthosine utilization system XapX-like protein
MVTWALCRLRRPAPLGCQILGPAGAAVGEVIAMAEDPIVWIAREQGESVDASVVTELMAGDFHLAATAYG